MFLCTTRYIIHNASAFAEEATKKVSLKLAEFSEPRFYHQFGKQCTFQMCILWTKASPCYKLRSCSYIYICRYTKHGLGPRLPVVCSKQQGSEH